MKIVLVAFSALFAFGTYACPDLSGNYKIPTGDSRNQTWKLEQVSCDLSNNTWTTRWPGESKPSIDRFQRVTDGKTVYWEGNGLVMYAADLNSEHCSEKTTLTKSARGLEIHSVDTCPAGKTYARDLLYPVVK